MAMMPFQFSFLLLFLTIVNALPPLLPRYLNATAGFLPGNFSSDLSSHNASKLLGQGILASSSTTPSIFNRHNQPMFPTSGNWTGLTCDVIETGSNLGSALWESASASDAWNQLMAGWNSPDRLSDLDPADFTTYVWTVFQEQTSAPNCLLIDSIGCSTLQNCENTTASDQTHPAPAAYLIMNSLTYLNEMFFAQNSAIDETVTTMDMTLLASTFAPATDFGDGEKILGYISDAFDLVSVGTLSTMFKGIKYLEKITDHQIETIKSVAENSVKAASTILSNLPEPPTDAETGAALGTILLGYYSNLKTALNETLNTFMNPTNQSSQQLLTSLMQTGLVLNFKYISTNFNETIAGQTAQMLWGKMIPAAWAISATPQIPFILRIDKDDWQCNSTTLPDNLKDFVALDTALKTLWCDSEGNSFFLLRANYDKRCAGRACDADTGYIFEALSGGDSTTLSGDNSQWGGLILANIIQSSWAGFILNGKMNGYQMPADSAFQVASNLSVNAGDGFPLEAGISTPGFFNITICLDPNEAVQNILTGDINSPAVCGTSPRKSGSTTDLNAPGQYTPGTCRVHVTQYQRHEGPLNLLNTYQIEVSIFDNAGLQIGGATKQNAAFPLILSDSVLPYSLIVAAQGPNDDSTVNFWYADQWFTSNDQAHHCNFGPYDSGSRQGDCNFDCPLPSGDPPASATITQPVPSGAITAITGTAATFVNSYITPAPAPAPATSTSAPAPASTPTYASGNCGMHIEQYQRNEGSENPTDTFELEITIFDAKQNAISESGRVQAPTGQPVTVLGLVSPLTVTASQADNDPLTFTFNGRQWSSDGGCSVGDYDSGNRNMDCGFPC